MASIDQIDNQDILLSLAWAQNALEEEEDGDDEEMNEDRGKIVYIGIAI